MPGILSKDERTEAKAFSPSHLLSISSAREICSRISDFVNLSVNMKTSKGVLSNRVHRDESIGIPIDITSLAPKDPTLCKVLNVLYFVNQYLYSIERPHSC